MCFWRYIFLCLNSVAVVTDRIKQLFSLCSLILLGHWIHHDFYAVTIKNRYSLEIFIFIYHIIFLFLYHIIIVGNEEKI